jgi:hypothetical protein
MAFPHEGGGVRRVLDHAVRVHQSESGLREWQRLPVADQQVLGGQAVVAEVLTREAYGSTREVDAGGLGPAPREPGQVCPDPAADFQHPSASKGPEVDQLGQVAEFVEAIDVQFVEEGP